MINVFPGPIDDEWNRMLPPPKMTPGALAKAIVNALKDGVEDVYPGDVAQEWLNAMAGESQDTRAGSARHYDLSFFLQRDRRRYAYLLAIILRVAAKVDDSDIHHQIRDPRAGIRGQQRAMQRIDPRASDIFRRGQAGTPWRNPFCRVQRRHPYPRRDIRDRNALGQMLMHIVAGAPCTCQAVARFGGLIQRVGMIVRAPRST